MSSRNGKSDNVCLPTSHSRAVRDGPAGVSRPVRGIWLRQVTDQDQQFLFQLITDPYRCHLWMSVRRVYDERQFREAWTTWMGDMFAEKFVVEYEGQAIGLIFAYDQYLQHGSTKIGTMIDHHRVGGGSGAIAWALFIDYLFRSLPIRKIYNEVHGFNPVVVRMLRKVGAIEEGLLKEDQYWDGSYWDLHVFAVYRAVWTQMRTRILPVKGAGESLSGQ